MSEPFLAEIKILAFNFAPRGWALCDGQILPINQYQSLYSLLGTNYGGDGRTTFGLPELRGRTPMHVGSGFDLGQKSGVENVILGISEIPSHTHKLKASSDNGDTPIPTNNVFAAFNNGYHPSGGSENLNMPATTVTDTGNTQGHNNMQPYLTLSFAIALQGLFPSRN